VVSAGAISRTEAISVSSVMTEKIPDAPPGPSGDLRKQAPARSVGGVGHRVLVVDDDPMVSDVVRRYLEQDGCQVEMAGDGLTALAKIQATTPDLVVLDLMLGGIDGLEVCRRLRRDRPHLPIVMLTALGEESDRVLGLETGADDYVTKPFSPRELALRVRSVLRRTASEPTGDKLADGELIADTGRRVAELGGRCP
jgi:DNA-binding response OmpR family regulator